MRRDVDPNEVAAGDPDDDETVQQPEADGGHDKEIDDGNVGSVIAQKRAPSLGRQPSPLDDVSGDCRLGHLEAQLEQFPVNARRTPQDILDAHSADQGAKITVDPWPADAPA
jgi:hypothetical protein